MTDQRDAGPVDDDVVAAGEQEELVAPGRKQDEPEQRPGERHGRALDRQRPPARFPHGIGHVGQVVKGQLDVGVIDRPLEDLAVHLEEGRPGRLGLPHRLPDRPLQGIALDHAVDPHEQTELPLGIGVTGLARQPDVQLSARQRKCLMIKLHPTPQPQGLPFNPPVV